MSKIRILIVDEAVVVRRTLSAVLTADPALEVVGTAPTARIALAKVTQVNPDVVLVSAEMPETDGQPLAAALRKTHPVLPVLLFNKLLSRGPELAPEYSEFALRPGESGSTLVATQAIKDDLIPRIKQCCNRGGKSEGRLSTAAGVFSRATPKLDPGPRPRSRVEIVAIGASTGGPNALTTFLSAVPADCPVPIVIVQHMPRIFTGFLADRLDARMEIGIKEGAEGDDLHPGHAWIAPGDYHMELAREMGTARVRLQQGPPENSCRPAVDVLFRSVAEVYGPGALAVVLSGMGQDGLRGCERIREAGGQILVQDEATSVVWGMPGFVARAGLADQVLPLDQLGPEALRLVRKGRALTAHG